MRPVAEAEGGAGVIPPLTLPLTPGEQKQLARLLKYEGVDVADPRAVSRWILYQVGIDPEPTLSPARLVVESDLAIPGGSP